MAEVVPQNELKLDSVILANEEEGPIIELGDRIRISGGAHDGTTGRVIFRSADELHLMPDGVTNSSIKFALTEDGFEEDAGVEAVEILQKRKKAALVDILDIGPGQLLQTFDAEGKPGPTFMVKRVDSGKDELTVVNDKEDPTGTNEISLQFNFRGVPDSLPFRVIRGRQAPEKLAPVDSSDEDKTGKAAKAEVEADSPDDDEGNSKGEGDGEDEDGEELEDFAFLDDELEEAPAQESDDIEYLFEIPKSERTYSAAKQKSEAYVDLISLNSPAIQKLAQTQKNTRILAELFFQLRAGILRVSEDGTPSGLSPVTVRSLIELLESRSFALSRPIIDISKVLYYLTDPEKEQPDDIDDIRFRYFDGEVTSSAAYLKDSSDMEGQKFADFLNGYLSRYGSSWYPNKDGCTPTAFRRDEEAFRLRAPGSESTVPGYTTPALYAGELPFSMVRGLKALRSKGKLVSAGEEACVSSYIMFPMKYKSFLSLHKQESLAADIKSGMRNFPSMHSVLMSPDKTVEVSDVPTSTDPFVIGVEGSTLGNIELRDYIKMLNLKAEGLGDFWPLQVLLGMREKEWTIDQFMILKEIVAKTQDAIMTVILRQREELAKLASQPPAVQGIQMTPDGPTLIQKLADEPIIKELQREIKEQMPAFVNSDVALVGLILRKHPDLAFAQLADQPVALTRSRMKYTKEAYLTTIRNIQLTKIRNDFSGEPPEPVNCPHVKPLSMIRRVKDNNTRLALLAKFLTNFQGTKADNWLTCRVGNHNLLCVHELLQVYQYLRPGDVAALNKDIQLNFGGGQFQGHYICRNCGQPISELEYDTHLEFDDAGRPMMGRAELVDKDAITMEEIESILGPEGQLDGEVEFDNETKKLIFSTAKQMAERLNVPMETSDYMLLVTRTFASIQPPVIPERSRYIEMYKAQLMKKMATAKATAATAATAAEAGGTDYDIYINRALIASVGANLLIIIQSRVPDFNLRGSNDLGCKGFRGKPLEPEGDTQGIDCIVGVISAFQKASAPWSLAKFQDEREETQRKLKIKGVVEFMLQTLLQDPSILQSLAKKREFRRTTLGAAGNQGRPDEQIPSNFAPIPFVMKPEDFVEKVIVPGAATVKDLAELWVRQGNHLAATNKLPKPLAFAETSCCLSPITDVDQFWKRNAVSLPPFKRMHGLVAPPRITRTEPTMKPAVISRPLPDAPENSYYKLFYKVCFEGEKKGRSHEFGLTRKCIWCNLKMPEEPTAAALEQQDVDIDVNKDTFEELLNDTHRANTFKTLLITEIPGIKETWDRLVSVEPELADGYKITMVNVQAELNKLPVDAKEDEVAIALSEFAIYADKLESLFKSRLGSAAQHDIFNAIEENGSESIIRFLQSYVVVPLKQFKSRSMDTRVIPKSWLLSSAHKETLQTLLKQHRGYLTKFNKVIRTPWLDAKVESCLLQTRASLDILSTLRPLQIPGGAQTYRFFIKLCLYAPLANFVDPNVLPLGGIGGGIEAPGSQVEQEALFPAKFISDMGARFKEEGHKLTPEQIRELIVERNEAEKMRVIGKQNDMTRTGKDIERMKMMYGIGEYAVGGTSLIYKYDQDRYDIEATERAEAGIVDFPGLEQKERQVDGLGYYRDDNEEEGYIGDEDLGDINGFDDDN